MKASELKAADLAGYLRIEPDDLDKTETVMLEASTELTMKLQT